MSDRLTEDDLKHLVNAVKGVICWRDLGLNLDVPPWKLEIIARENGIEDGKREMLSTWLKFDLKASWEKLACALTAIGENVVAANVRSQYVRAVCKISKTLTEDEQTCMFIYWYLKRYTNVLDVVITVRGAVLVSN